MKKYLILLANGNVRGMVLYCLISSSQCCIGNMSLGTSFWQLSTICRALIAQLVALMA